MREAINFTFDDISSEDMGVHIVSLDGGLYEETFLPTRRLIETTATNREKPYFQRVESDTLSFSLSIYIYDWKERDNLRQIARWLYQDYYKPLTFDTQPERIFYAIVEGDSSLHHNGAKEGYITLSIRCDSPYTYSPVQTVYPILSRVANTTNQEAVYNGGDLTVKPRMRITKKLDDGAITVKNTTTNQTFTLDNLQLDEQVFIDCDNEEIISSLQYLNVYRYDNHNNVWIDFIEDENVLEFTGDFDIELEYEMKYLTE